MFILILRILKYLNIFSDKNIYTELFQEVPIQEVDISEVVDRWEYYHNKIEHFARESGSKVSFFLQPYNGSGMRAYSNVGLSNTYHIRRRKCSDGSSSFDLNESVYREMAFRCKNKENFFSLVRVFDQCDSEVYIDQVHFSDIGAELISEEISRLHFGKKVASPVKI